MKKRWSKWLAMPLIASVVLAGCQDNPNKAADNSPNNSPESSPAAANGKPATWIADRTIKALMFIDSDDYTKGMNPEIAKVLKEKTGITLDLEGVTAEHAIDGLTAGLASGDLPDFIVSYLNNSGRPEMSVLLKGAREGLFTDLTPLMKNTKVYSKYLQDKYLPVDTQYGVMFRPEFKGSSYFAHMNIPREGGYQETEYVGGPYIRKDIADALKIDPKSITTSEQLADLAAKIKAGNFKDKNGKNVIPIGSKYWGNGKKETGIFSDLIWGAFDQRFNKDKSGKIVHESQTDYPMKRVEYTQKLLKDKLIDPELFTMEENRATEGAQNGTYAIISDMHNYLDFNKDMHYVPLGPINNMTNGTYQMQLSYKSGYNIWAIPKTTKNPEDIMKLADFLASREGKLLWQYGIEGRDYTLDAKGNPLVKKEVLDLRAKDPNKAKELGFDGVGNSWGSYLGGTDFNRLADFGEKQYGDAVSPDANGTAYKILENWGYQAKKKDAAINDGYSPLSIIGEVKNGEQLKAAFDNWNDSMIRAFYAKSTDEAKKILDSASAQLKSAGLDKFEELLDKKNADPKTKIILN